MSEIIVFTNLTLDGVMQSPARPDEDDRDGFEHGGWATPYGAMQEAGDALANVGAVLFGRWTYENFYATWPKRVESPFSTYFNNIQKYVVSTTLDEPLAWINSTLIKGDVAHTVGKLKKEIDKDIVVFGSGLLTQTLIRCNLVDRYVLLIHPLVLGSGRRLFTNGASTSLRLTRSKTTNNGVVIASYEPATKS
jgi:dihydrofolate reductase